MKNIRDFYLKNFSFLEVKFSIYLNRRIFVMKERKRRNANKSAKAEEMLRCPLPSPAARTAGTFSKLYPSKQCEEPDQTVHV